jgi:GT2 family glycosyltransferase
MSGPAISVVVPTYQRADRIGRLLTALAAQDVEQPFEVVVVDDGSSDGTAEIVESVGRETGLAVRVLRQPQNAGPAAARNRGWRDAAAPIVAFTDDDCAPQPGWLRALLATAEDADVVQGRTIPDPAHAERLGPFSRTVVAEEEGLYPTCNVAYRKSLLEALDGFDRRLRRSCDDTDLAWRAREQGARTAFAPDALVYHEITPSSLRALLRTIPRWDDVALVVKLHPVLRRYLTNRVFWRRSHRSAIAAVAGAFLVLAPSRVLRLAGLALLLPYARHRVLKNPLPGTGRGERVLLLPPALVVDVAEIAVMIKGSARSRCLVL